MGGIIQAAFICMFVIMISVVVSVVASIWATRAMGRRLREAQSTGLVGAGGGLPVAGGLTAGEAIHLRNIIQRTLSPQPMETIAWAQQRYPNATRDELARRIITAEAAKCGFIGFITGAPGAFGMLVTMPIDLISTGRIQASMVYSLALIYGVEQHPDDAAREGFMVMLGGGSIARTGSQLILKLVGKGAIEAIPIIGAFTGYAVNYLLVQAVGRAVIARYTGKLNVETARQLASTVQEKIARTTGRLSLPNARPATGELVARPAALAPALQPRVQELAAPQIVTGAQDAAAAGERPCPACTSPNPAGNRFCSSCGAILGEAKAAP